MISPYVLEQLKDIAKRVSTINKIILFGSRAVGDHSDRSDIDLAFVAPNMTSEEWTKIYFTIEDELDTLLRLDLVKYEDASEDLKREIKQHGKVIYTKHNV